MKQRSLLCISHKLWPGGEFAVDWRVEDRFFLKMEDPKLNAWVVYNQSSRWSVEVFDRSAETTVLTQEEPELDEAKKTVQRFIWQKYRKDIAADSWTEALTPRSEAIDKVLAEVTSQSRKLNNA